MVFNRHNLLYHAIAFLIRDDVRKLVEIKKARFVVGNLEKLNNQTPNKGAPCGPSIRIQIIMLLSTH